MTFQNFFTERTLFRDVKLLPAGCMMVVAAEQRRAADRALLGFRVRRARGEGDARRIHRGVRPPVPPGGDPPAGQRRAGQLLSQRRHRQRLDHRAGGAPDRESAQLHRRLRPAFGLGPRTRHGRARGGRAHVVPVQDRALRDGAQGRRHGARDAAHGLAYRGAAGRPELPELLCGPAGGEVRQGGAGRAPAATNCSAAIPGATTGRWSTTISSITSIGTTASGSGCSPIPSCASCSRRCGPRCGTSGRATSSATSSRATPPN